MQSSIFCASSEILTAVGYLSLANQQKICVKIILTWTATIYFDMVARYDYSILLCNYNPTL